MLIFAYPQNSVYSSKILNKYFFQNYHVIVCRSFAAFVKIFLPLKSAIPRLKVSSFQLCVILHFGGGGGGAERKKRGKKKKKDLIDEKAILSLLV